MTRSLVGALILLQASLFSTLARAQEDGSPVPEAIHFIGCAMEREGLRNFLEMGMGLVSLPDALGKEITQSKTQFKVFRGTQGELRYRYLNQNLGQNLRLELSLRDQQIQELAQTKAELLPVAALTSLASRGYAVPEKITDETRYRFRTVVLHKGRVNSGGQSPAPRAPVVVECVLMTNNVAALSDEWIKK